MTLFSSLRRGFTPRFSHYNSFHALPSSPTFKQIPPYNCPPFHTPDVHLYPPLYIPTSDPRYPNGRQHVHICRVGKLNFDIEMLRIKNIVDTTEFRYVTIDTEYPGTIYKSTRFEDRNPEGQYRLMKANVDEMSLIQLGLTLSDAEGNLATWGPNNQVFVWEFVISDFDIKMQPFNVNSIKMLFDRGLDFAFHRYEGVSSLAFVNLLRFTGLVPLEHPKLKERKDISWITFHGAYDFGYLIKALTSSKLPDTLPEFKDLVQKYFGKGIYDVKHMLKLFRKPEDVERNKKLTGGLVEVSVKNGVRRVMGIGNQSGSDSLLTLLVFKKLKELYDSEGQIASASAGHIFPLAK